MVLIQIHNIEFSQFKLRRHGIDILQIDSYLKLLIPKNWILYQNLHLFYIMLKLELKNIF